MPQSAAPVTPKTRTTHQRAWKCQSANAQYTEYGPVIVFGRSFQTQRSHGINQVMPTTDSGISEKKRRTSTLVRCCTPIHRARLLLACAQ